MKSFPSIVSLCIISVCVVGLLVSCGKKGRRYADVDVAAQVQLLKTGDSDQRANACATLGSAGPRAAAAVPDLAEALKDRDVLVRSLAAYALGEIGTPARSAIPELKAALNDPDPSVISSAANAIRAIDPDTYGSLTIMELQRQAR